MNYINKRCIVAAICLSCVAITFELQSLAESKCFWGLNTRKCLKIPAGRFNRAYRCSEGVSRTQWNVFLKSVCLFSATWIKPKAFLPYICLCWCCILVFFIISSRVTCSYSHWARGHVSSLVPWVGNRADSFVSEQNCCFVSFRWSDNSLRNLEIHSGQQ